MKTQKPLLKSLWIVGLLLLTGCAARTPNYAAMPADDLFQRAEAAYAAEEFSRAIPMLEVFVQQHFGDPRAPRARLLLGSANLERKEYITAAANFQRLVNDFPSSPLQRDARFGICQAYYYLSPRAPLDQEYTHSALLHCQSIVDHFPGTSEAERAAEYVDELTTKLARKALDTGLFYFKRRAYDAALVYFRDVVDQYPGTSAAATALSHMMETYELLGYVEEAQEARDRLLKEYPQSPEARGLQP